MKSSAREGAIEDVAEERDCLVADEGHFLPCDRIDDLAHRRHRATELRKITAESEDTLGYAGLPVAAEHLLFDNVEAIVDRVGGVEVAVDDHVEERPEQEAFLGLPLPAELELEATHDLVDGNRAAVLRGVTECEHPSGPDDQIDLSALEVVFEELAVVHRHVEALAQPDELCSLLLRVDQRVDDHRTELELADDVVALFGGGLLTVDPHRCILGIDGRLQGREVDILVTRNA